MDQDSIKQRTKYGLYWKSFDTLATNLMQLVVGVIMARLLTPADYGITALPAIFMAVAGTLIDGGFGLALIRKPDLTEKDLSTSFYYNIGMGISLYLLLFISAPWIALFYETPILTKLIRITAIVFLINPIITPQNVIRQRKLDFKTPARISIINKIVKKATKNCIFCS